MHEGTDHTQGKGDAMTKEQDENHDQNTQPQGHSGRHVQRQGVEHATQYTTGKTEGKETDVTEQVAQQARCHAIGFPHTAADVAEHTQDGLLVTGRIVVQEYAQGTDAYDAHQQVLHPHGQFHTACGQTIEHDGAQQCCNPREGAHGIGRSICMGRNSNQDLLHA